MATERRNILVLAACQALGLAANATVFTIGGLAGAQLAVDKARATLPMTCYVFGNAVATVPVSLAMKRLGRPAGFSIGAILGLIGIALSIVALRVGSLACLGLGMFFFGLYGAGAQHYRYAAAEWTSYEHRSRAIALVLGGGVAGALLGPEISKWTIDLFATRFVGGYAVAMIDLVLAALAVWMLNVPAPAADPQMRSGRPLAAIAAQPSFVVAVLGSAFGHGAMNVLMMATPLAMSGCGHPFGATAFVIQWHLVAMFAPSFVTGSLVARVGALPVMLVGVVLQAACVAVALSGVELAQFWLALVLLGVGWNLLYVGGTTLLTGSYRPEERAVCQGVNELAIAGTLMVASSASGWLVARHGWLGPNLAALPLVAVTGVAVVGLMAHRRVASAKVAA
jgi:MFS family permease